MAYPNFVEDGGLSSTSGQTITAAFPSPIAANDLLILTICKDGTTGTISAHPSGFTFIHLVEVTGSGFFMATYWKRATGSETGTVYLTWATVPDNITSSIIYRYSNVSTSGSPPVDYGFGAGSGSTPEASMDIIGGTTSGTQRLVINVSMCFNGTGAATVGNASGYSESIERQGSIGSGYVTAKAQEQEVATASTISDETSSINGNNSLWITDSFAIVPGVGWPHNFLGVANANIGEINTVLLADIEEVSGVA